MINNDVLRSLRYMLDINDAKLAEIAALVDYPLDGAAVAAYLKKDDEAGYVPCSDAALAHILDGLVIFRRGRDPGRTQLPVEKHLSNNSILKKLRIAFELKEDDLHSILQSADLPMTRAELSALFRKPGQKNFRLCGDQVLRNFLRGLTLRQRA